jgi:hypothetical protein
MGLTVVRIAPADNAAYEVTANSMLFGAHRASTSP